MESMSEPIGLTVLTGFLGSGKSTLVRRLLRHPDLADTAVIVNEFGEVGIDHALVAASKEDVVLMSSGCLCCTVRGDLLKTLTQLHRRRQRGEVPSFRRVLVETTGLADPAPILQTLMANPNVVDRYPLQAVITAVDAFNGGSTLDRHDEAMKQAAVADTLLLTKTDIADADAAAALTRRLKTLNPAAPIHVVVQGEIDPALIFRSGPYELAGKIGQVKAWLNAEAYDDEHDHEHDVNRHDAEIGSFCLTFEQPFDWDRLGRWFELLTAYRGADLLRVKGLINVTGERGPVVIHAVQHVFHPPTTLASWPDDDRRSRVVFITRNLGRERIEKTLSAADATA